MRISNSITLRFVYLLLVNPCVIVCTVVIWFGTPRVEAVTDWDKMRNGSRVSHFTTIITDSLPPPTCFSVLTVIKPHQVQTDRQWDKTQEWKGWKHRQCVRCASDTLRLVPVLVRTSFVQQDGCLFWKNEEEVNAMSHERHSTRRGLCKMSVVYFRPKRKHLVAPYRV